MWDGWQDYLRRYTESHRVTQRNTGEHRGTQGNTREHRVTQSNTGSPSELSVIKSCHIIQVTILSCRVSLGPSELSAAGRCHIIGNDRMRLS